MPSKVSFSIVALLHATGEVEMNETDDHVFIHPVVVMPVITIISPEKVEDADKDRIKMMALHQLVRSGLEKVTPKGIKVMAPIDINMTPSNEESN